MENYIKPLFAVIIILTGTCLATSEAQTNQERHEKRRQEYQTKNNLSNAVVSWLSDGKTSDATESDRLADLLLNQEKPSVEDYFIAAQVANLRGKTDKAISILEDVIRKHPTEIAPGTSLPVKIVGRFWIGTIARQLGNTAKAKNVYAAILDKLEGEGSKKCLSMICNLYLAEVEEESGHKGLALGRLQAIEDVEKPVTENWGILYDVYNDWGKYERVKKSESKEQADQQLIAKSKNIMHTALLGHHQLLLSGMTGAPLVYYGNDERKMIVSKTLFDRAINNSKSPVDRSLTRIVRGHVNEEMGKFSDAEENYSALFEKDSYFSPMAGIYLGRCRKAQGKNTEADSIFDEVKTKYPGYNSAIAEIKKNPQAFTPKYK